MASNKPATSLPWDFVNVSSQGKVLLVDSDGTTLTTLSYRGDEDDAVYIAHAANAYPRLVETLRVLKRAVNDKEPDAVVVFAAIERARALLQDLGEQS